MKRVSRDKLVPHGQRYKTVDPVATVKPGQTIVVETINHMTPVVRSDKDLHHFDSPEYRERQETGPIAVEGAAPGDMLSVRIEDIEFVGLPHAIGAGPLWKRFPQEPMAFPVDKGHCHLPGGAAVPVTPMVGDIYTVPSGEPSFCDHGGNMDFTEVRPGNTLYLPVYREGGLLVLGDVHALQGDGEIYGEAAETASDVTLTLGVEKKMVSKRPVVDTADTLVTLACRGDIHESTKLAVDDMVSLLGRIHGMAEHNAYVLACLAGSVRLAGCLFWRDKRIHSTIVALSVPKKIVFGA